MYLLMIHDVACSPKVLMFFSRGNCQTPPGSPLSPLSPWSLSPPSSAAETLVLRNFWPGEKMWF
jgi:hypothetical protein